MGENATCGVKLPFREWCLQVYPESTSEARARSHFQGPLMSLQAIQEVHKAGFSPSMLASNPPKTCGMLGPGG